MSSISEIVKGVSVMENNEEQTKVGGIWTDGTNFFLRVD